MKNSIFTWWCLLLLGSALTAQTTFEFGCDGNTLPRIVGTSGFSNATPGNTQCIDFADWDIDPADIVEDYSVNLFYDGGVTAVTFTTENGASVTATLGDHFATATLPDDGSTFICATIAANSAAAAGDVSFFALVPLLTTENSGASGVEAIDDEIFQECGVENTFPISLTGNAIDRFDVNIELALTEIEQGDPRTLTFTFEACGVILSETVNVEPLPGRPSGFSIYRTVIPDVPGDCTEITYEYCSDVNDGQSYGVGFTASSYACCQSPEVAPTVNCSYDAGTGQNTFTLDLDITTSGSPAGETLVVTFNGTEIANVAPDNTDGNVSLTGLALTGVGPSFQNQLRVAYSGSPDCADTRTLNLIACTDDCDGGTDEVGGNVFLDNNNDGADAGANEVGQGNVLVRVYDCDGDLACEVYTNAAGDWSCDGLTEGEEYRVEYTTPLTPWLMESFAGPDNGTSTQFVIGGTCMADYGLLDPAEFCNTFELSYAVSCYESGDGTGPNATNASFISFSSDATADTPAPSKDITIAEVGSVWGTAHIPETSQVYAGSLLKRHTALADGLGYVYQMDYTDINAPTLTNSFDLEGRTAANTGNAISFGTVCRDASCMGQTTTNTGIAADYELPPDPTAPSVDLDAFEKVGKVGFGDIDYDENSGLLWMVNLNDRTLLSMDVSANTAGEINEYPIAGGAGVPACPNGAVRPWALEFSKGAGFLGITCDGSLSGNTNDVVGYILQFDPLNPGAGFSVLREVSFVEFNRGSDFINADLAILVDPQAWWSTYADVAQSIRDGLDARGPNGVYSIRALQPLISDIDFAPDGDLIVGVMDRTPLQMGFLQSTPESQSDRRTVIIAYGDIYNFCFENGNYAREGEGSCPSPFAFGGDYFDLQVGDGSNDGALGSMVIDPNSGELIYTVWDPFPPGEDVSGIPNANNPYLNSQGIHWNDLTTGERTDWYRIVTRANEGNSQNFGKGLGLGDLISLCDEAPIQIGNYAWIDSNADGIQDPCEPPLTNLTVKLYSKPEGGGTPLLLATTKTDDSGNYYFAGDGLDDTVWEDVAEDTLVSGNNYFVAFCGDDGYDETNNRIRVNGQVYCLSPADATGNNGNDQNDNDVVATAIPGFGTLPAYCTVDGETETTNHTFDAGFKPVPFDLALRKTVDAVATPGPYRPGDEVTFTIRVFNQGEVDATRINVYDYVPAGTTIVSGTSGAVTTLEGAAANVMFSNGNFAIDALAAADSLDLSITLQLNSDFSGTTLRNWAEIRSADNDDDPTTEPPSDVDSTPDASNFNQPGETDDLTDDDVIDQDGKNGGDEDDHDPAEVPVQPCPTGDCGGAPTGTLNND